MTSTETRPLNGAPLHGADVQPARDVTYVGANMPTEYDPRHTAGSLFNDEESDPPFFYFNSIPEAWRWLCSWSIPGMGMFCEAYFIFSIGNIGSFFTYEYPLCWGKYEEGCTVNTTRAPGYMQIVGIIFGMMSLGYLGDKIGRKWGSVSTVSIMMVGCILLTLTGLGTSDKGMVIMYIVAQFVFGYGVGGEYPMAAGSAAERAEAGGKKMAAARGREVVMTFSMQGVGNFTNVAVLLILMCCFDTITPIHGLSKVAYYPDRLEGVWRVSFALGAIPLAFLIYYRIFRLRESAVWVRQSSNSRAANLGLMFKYYWHRLVATAGGWFLWDFSFYGNKLFQSTFIKIISPTSSLFTTLLWTLLNSGIALIGYWAAACVIDNRYMGRLRLQLLGFFWVAVLFFVSAIWYHPLTSSGGIHVFQFIYFFSSFWGQFGPNCTTFLLAGELYPTDVRTTAHGISAGVAKMGALWASVWFNYLSNRTKFWLTSSFNVGGFFLTALFLPEPLRVSLAEVDRRWHCLQQGRPYYGEAINPKNLSLYERLTGQAKMYDKARDEEDRWQEGLTAAGKTGANGKAKDATVV